VSFEQLVYDVAENDEIASPSIVLSSKLNIPIIVEVFTTDGTANGNCKICS